MPNRILKESICTSPSLERLTAEEERFFYRLLVVCDDFGRFDARPAVLRARCFPLLLGTITDAKVARWLESLTRAGLVRLYTVDGHPYLEMAAWEKHQQMRAKRSKFPAPDSTGYQVLADASNSPRIRNPNPKRESESDTDTTTPSPAVTAATVDDEGFARFWLPYPWKAGKPEALKAWAKLSAADRAAATAAVPVWLASGEWTKDDGRWIPRPATFLNQRRWEDQPKQVPRGSPAPPASGMQVGLSAAERTRRMLAEKLGPGSGEPTRLGNVLARIAPGGA